VTEAKQMAEILTVRGQVIEVGRDTEGRSEVVLRVGDRCVHVCGLSDDTAKRAARSLYANAVLMLTAE